MARIGKAEVFAPLICEGCGKPIDGPHSILIPDKTKPQEVVRLHAGMECAEYWAFSGPLAIKVEQAIREEIGRVWKYVDPVTREKMKKFL